MMKKWVVLLLMLFFLFPQVSQAEKAGQAEKQGGTIAGQVVNEQGEPLPGGVVSFFDTKKGFPMIGKTHRIPDMVSRMGPDGKFSRKVLTGTYYMGALIITDPGRGPGPPREGETFYFIRDDKGNLREFTVKADEVNDFGKMIGAGPDTFAPSKDMATIEGRLVLQNGQPFVGGVVLAKIDMDSQRPDFVSDRTGEDGRYKMKLPANVSFFLVGRERAIGRPVPGTYVGTYGSTEPISSGGSLPIGRVRPPSQPTSGIPQALGVEVGPGDKLPDIVRGKPGEKISGVDITVFLMPVPGQQREKLQGTLGFSKELQKGEAGEVKPAERELKK